MACVAYWNSCNNCKKETYDRSRKHRCDCGGEIYSIMEFDEWQDHDPEPVKEEADDE